MGGIESFEALYFLAIYFHYIIIKIKINCLAIYMFINQAAKGKTTAHQFHFLTNLEVRNEVCP